MSAFAIVFGLALLAWIVFAVCFGARVEGVEPAAPSEPDELDGLFEDWPTTNREEHR